MKRIETVSIIYQHPRILLGMKKVRFGKERYNGFGGGVQFGESLIESAIRETKEEAGITLTDPLKIGNILFHFQSKEKDHDVYFFRATQYIGKPKESEEMKPKWFDIDKIPYEKMWPDDKYWLPLLLKGKSFQGKFEFDLEGKISAYKLEELLTLD